MSQPAPGSQRSDAQRLMMYHANAKSAGAAYVVWFIFGLFGGHRFYLGKGGTGAIMLILALVSFLTVIVGVGLIGLAVVGIWAFIDLFCIGGWVRDYNMRVVVANG